ncbi:hypothetical protein C8C83_3274 [Flavobacterium sp. 90]|nr:hypothetical protein C8C82_3585 [Flavobacterium sp. 81]TCK55318.1 hypothetical protein C8C83_3274 [Flavobacterium sp. 90]
MDFRKILVMIGFTFEISKTKILTINRNYGNQYST